MRRGELYRVHRKSPVRSVRTADPRDFRVFVIVSRQVLIDSQFSTVVCAPVYSRSEGLSTQLDVGTAEGLKKDSAIFCDELISVDKSRLTDFVGTLSAQKLNQLSHCLRIATGCE